MNDRMTYLERICCCDLTLFGLPKHTSNCPLNLTNASRFNSKLHRFPVTSTAGGLTNTVCGPRRGLRTTSSSAKNKKLQKQTKKPTDRPGYSNKHNGKHPHASQEKKKKKNHVSSIHTHAHTQIFSNTLVSFLTHRSSESWTVGEIQVIYTHRCLEIFSHMYHPRMTDG